MAPKRVRFAVEEERCKDCSQTGRTLGKQQRRLDAQLQQLRTTQALVQELQQQLDASQQSEADLERQLWAMRGQRDAATLEAEEMRGQRDTARQEAAEMQTQLDAARQEAAEMQTQLEAARREASEMRGKIDAARRAAAEAESARLAQRQREDAHAAAEARLAELLQEVASYKIKLRRCEVQLGACRADLAKQQEAARHRCSDTSHPVRNPQQQQQQQGVEPPAGDAEARDAGIRPVAAAEGLAAVEPAAGTGGDAKALGELTLVGHVADGPGQRGPQALSGTPPA